MYNVAQIREPWVGGYVTPSPVEGEGKKNPLPPCAGQGKKNPLPPCAGQGKKNPPPPCAGRERKTPSPLAGEGWGGG